ncbi:hypothetical protein GDO81_015300 [Engystomops pustulosus]|uniref:Aftiphilin clathrin-binding box domain-containing protein n=1 Tax=Engystomops pustulosus TaxID=76066 RepID=A0AAV7AI78_ENGPU|nr:hypothetical protein GDO81_015300 [Engystomops pustulosus]KAG8561242.1 hypothetical protein GDO81_015300 [Engystomops pustulosus]
MKDGSGVINECGTDEDTLLPVQFTTGSENRPGGAIALHKDCDVDKSSPEVTSTWGDFESFTEFTPQPEQLLHENEALDENVVLPTIPDGGDYTDQTEGEAQWDAFNLGNENRQECERIFRLSFPAIAVGGTQEEVKSLEALLTSSDEENISHLIKTRLWLECDSTWQNSDGTKSGSEWQNSKGCTDLMMLLGLPDKNSSDDGGKTNDALIGKEHFTVNKSTPPAGNKCLIQTKLDVGSGCKSGHIFSYQLVLKKSQTDVSLPFLTFSGKKSFFSANQLRFNF